MRKPAPVSSSGLRDVSSRAISMPLPSGAQDYIGREAGSPLMMSEVPAPLKRQARFRR
ncbi:hypothetical protein KCP77_18420 [Salmonella enterica subsp. enterica]|nr:hypothetical protein KCP77_18420 [Salmonella enterica subsp. enterica]